MVYINDKKFKTYTLDTIDTFKNRVSVFLNTLPIFLYFPDKITSDDIRPKSKKKIEVIDFLAEIKNSAKNNSSLVELVDDIQKKMGKNYNVEKENGVIDIWVAHNDFLHKLSKKASRIEKLIADLDAKKLYSSTRLYKNLEKDNIEKIKKTIDRSLDIFRRTSDIYTSQLVAFESSIDIESTLLKIEDVQYIIKFNLEDTSILEMFNDIILNKNTPFASSFNFFKILRDFIPSNEWVVSVSNELKLKVSKKPYDVTYDVKDINYSDVVFKMDQNKEVIAEVNINTEKGNISNDEFISRSFSVFETIKISVKEKIENRITGIFYIPNVSFNRYILSDLCLNDEVFSSLISIDDHEKATKKKAGIYIHFSHPSTGYITATLTSKKMIKGDIIMKDEDQGLFPAGKSYVRIRVTKANNSESVKKFQKIIGKLFSLYQTKEKDIISLYKRYIHDFGDIYEEEEEISLKQSDTAPDLFITNYTRNCKLDRMPSIITEEEAMKAQEQGKNVMKFPRDVMSDPNKEQFPMDGKNQHWYICNNDKYTFCGVKENKLKNADKYPYVPCCFLVDQTNKSKYLHYFKGQTLEKKDKKQDIIKTDKFLTNTQFGLLPQNIDILFAMVSRDTNTEYIRKGMSRNENSFLNCVMEALDNETNILSITDDDEREAFLTDKRNELATAPLSALCRQEMYDKTIDEIISTLKNPHIYLDPKLFIHLLEDYFKCNIFLFSKRDIRGDMILPRHLKSYYKHKNTNKCIYIFEHMGSDSDLAKYPQCELIVKYNTEKTGEAIYSFSYKEADGIRKIFKKLKESYALDTLIKDIDFIPRLGDIQIESQWIDSYGKTRRLNIKYIGKLITLIFDPIQPIRVIETKSDNIYKTTVTIAQKLIDQVGIKITSQSISGRHIKEINGVLGNVNISIPVEDSSKLDEVDEKHELSYSYDQESALVTYNKNKKIARYLIEYVIWIYSNFLNTENIKEITDGNIARFGAEKFKIIGDYQYGYIQKTFTIKSPILSKDGKIIIHNEDTLKRLLYVLRITSQRNLDAVLNYYNKKGIQNYYSDITDFEYHMSQVILQGEESVEKWANENNAIYKLYDEIQIEIKEEPYFFKNNAIENKIFLAQNAKSIEKATDIALTWVKNGYNIGKYAENKDPVEFTLYVYNTDGTFNEQKVDGQKTDEEIKIIGYKRSNQALYTVLLSLDA